jgi:hypothetical protein
MTQDRENAASQLSLRRTEPLLLTAEEFHHLAEVPAEVEWFANSGAICPGKAGTL